MIAVVYSGSRFASWKLAEKGKVVADFKTAGINPFFNDEKYITQLLNKKNELINNAEKIRRIYFFGAGASSGDRKDIIGETFGNFFRYSRIAVDNDLKAAALATCGDRPGIVGVIGSGSNAAYYNGKKLVKNNYGLGYILGDEGSANWLGRRLLKQYLNGVLPADFGEKLSRKYDLDRKQILDKVYKQPQPALFLSSFADFLMDNREEHYVKLMVMEGFRQYLRTYILPLNKQFPAASLNFAGTVAAGFSGWLREAAHAEGLEIRTIIREPIDNLLIYYVNKN